MVAEQCKDPAIKVQLHQPHRRSWAMATIETLRVEIIKEFQKTVAVQKDQRVKIQNVADAHTEYKRWKIDTEGRMLRHDNQQATLNSKASELVARLEKLEKGGTGLLPDAARGKDRWRLTRPKDMHPAEFAGKEEE